jgi:hypothetical protein
MYFNQIMMLSSGGTIADCASGVAVCIKNILETASQRV